MAGLAVRVGIALAVPRLGVGAAAAAHPHVARLDRSSLLPRRVVEVGLDRRRRATEPIGDLRDRQPLGLAECRANATARRRSTTRSAAAWPFGAIPRRYRRHLVFSPRSFACSIIVWSEHENFGLAAVHLLNCCVSACPARLSEVS